MTGPGAGSAPAPGPVWDISGFDPRLRASGGGLAVAPLAPADYDGLRSAMSDPLIWEQHGGHANATEAGFARWWDVAREARTALTVRRGDRVVGSSRYYAVQGQDAPCIGWTFLTRDLWGGSANATLKSMMLAHAFAHATVVGFHIAPGNRRSQAAVRKLGAREVARETLRLGPEPASWVTFHLRHDDWSAP
ncbi:MAG: GNAT family N-acetyltransferase [Paracoccaceae bacterium]